MDDSIAGDEWKQYARESDQVWYIGGTNAEDRINLDFVTEPGLLTDHHLVTRLTNNNGNVSFAAQVRLDFNAVDPQSNLVWGADGLKFRLDQLLANSNIADRSAELSKISVAERDQQNLDLLSTLLPGEGDFKVILIDALGGNDQIVVGPTVQKTVWIDAGAGDDTVQILAGNSILVDKSESSLNTATGLRSRNDRPGHAFTLTKVEGGSLKSFDGISASADGLEFNGLTIDNPNDVDWYRFTLASAPATTAVIDLASGSSIDRLAMEIYAENDLANRLKLGTSNGTASQISLSGLQAGVGYLLKVTTPFVVPTIYGLRFVVTNPATADLAAIPKFNLGLRNDSTERRDVILGGTGNDVLQGGAGEDWIFGNDGDDVLTGDWTAERVTCSLVVTAMTRSRSFRMGYRCWEIRPTRSSILRPKPLFLRSVINTLEG